MEEGGRRDGNLVREFCRQLRVSCVDDLPDSWYFPPPSKIDRWTDGKNPYSLRFAVDVTAAWPARRWPVDRWREVVRGLLKMGKVFLVGRVIPKRGEDREEYPRGLGAWNAHNLIDRTDVHAYAALVKDCDLWLGHDTGGFHIAAAVRTPEVCIFSRSRARGYHLTTALEPTRSCSKFCGLECIEERPCILDITPDMVLEAVRQSVRRFGLMRRFENAKEKEGACATRAGESST
jgi:ADP-heptose:LPS heptosyltransferase